MEMLISYGGELMKVQITNLEEQSLVSVVVEGEGVDIYLNGSPVDPDTGIIIPEVATDPLLAAADRMARLWADGAWKLSTDAGKLHEAIRSYQEIRAAGLEKSMDILDKETKNHTPSVSDKVQEAADIVGRPPTDVEVPTVTMPRASGFVIEKDV